VSTPGSVSPPLLVVVEVLESPVSPLESPDVVVLDVPPDGVDPSVPEPPEPGCTTGLSQATRRKSRVYPPQRMD